MDINDEHGNTIRYIVPRKSVNAVRVALGMRPLRPFAFRVKQ